MDRRAFNKLAGLSAIGTLGRNLRSDAKRAASPEELIPATEHQSLSEKEIILEDQELVVAFDAISGALTRLKRESTGWTIERRPELGVSFRLLVPLPGRRYNFVLGQKQRAVQVEKLSDHRVSLKWKDVISEHGGALRISFEATVTLEKGALTFESTLTNDSPLAVETIDYPYLGDLNPPKRDKPMHARIMRYDNLQSDEIYPNFENEKGYWGVRFPTKSLDSCYSLFCLIQAPDEGLYVEMHDPTAPYLLQYTFEQHPGNVHGSAVPETVEISGLAVHLEFRTCHFVFAQPRSVAKLAPVVFQCYSGDWHGGIDLYKRWRATWFRPTQIPDWITDVHSWQQLQVNTPEEDFSIPYRDLVSYGEEALNNGVSVIQLTGWNHGGQDRGNPSQDTDPGLGTWRELYDAIAQIQAKGVKIILFGKFPWADITTEWYKTELHKYATIDPYGIPYQAGGDSYLTPTQLAGINNRRFAVMDFLCPKYREIATTEFQKLLRLGAAGWLYDEVCDCVIGKYNFALGHGYDPPGFIYAGNLPLAKQLRTAADEVNRNFLFAGEGPQDWLTQYYRVSYFRTDETRPPIARYIDPYAPLVVAVIGFDDRETLNLILQNRYIISYEPYNFKGRLGNFPLTLAYGQKVDALRHKYKEYLWDAEFRDTLGAQVIGDGEARHSVFVTSAGKRAVVVVNPFFKNSIAVKVELPNPGRLSVATPEEPDARPTIGELIIPARSAAVVMEL